MRTPGFTGQAQSGADDLVGRLLGIDRVNLREGNWSLDFQNALPLWVMLLVVVPAIAGASWFLYRRERQDVPRGMKGVLTTLRGLLVLLVILLLMGPVLTVEVIKERKSYILALVDDSLSMKKVDLPNRPESRLKLARICALVDDSTQQVGPEIESQLRRLTRADVLKRVLENPKLARTASGEPATLLEEIEAKLNVAYFTFSKGARVHENRGKLFESYDAKNLIGTETAIGDSIRQALSMYRGQHVAAIVVLSDGRNNFGVEPERIAAEMGRQYKPIYTVLAGIPQKPHDIEIMDLQVQEAVLVNDKLSIHFAVKQTGYEGQKADVNLHVVPIKDETADLTFKAEDLDRYLQESRLDQTAPVTLDASGRQNGTLIWQCKDPGRYLLLLRIPPREDERSERNNLAWHVVRVVDDKIKVLYVEHPPRYEYRFLKNALIRDPRILCHCVLTSADEGFPQEHSRESGDPEFREPLKTFPTTRQELFKYDVLIFGDVDPHRLGGRDTWENIERFVADFGGGVVFISGVMHNPRSFKETPLENLLPVIPDETRGEPEAVYDQPFGYRLTDDAKDAREGRGGTGHPIIMFPSLAGDLNKTVEQWEDRDGRRDGLQGVRWFQRVTKVKPGGRVLVELSGVPGMDVPGRRPPLFVTQMYGAGRVFWSGTDETWLWRYCTGDSPWFYPFWQQAMYWTRYGKLLGSKRYRLRLDRPDRRYITGDDVTFFVTAFDKNFEPLSEPELELNLEPPTGTRMSLRIAREGDRPGSYVGKWRPGEVGPYRVWAGEPGDESTRSPEQFTVYIPNREEDEPILDEEELRRIAHASHPPGYKLDHKEGECPNFFGIETVEGLPAALKEERQNLTEIKEDDLWDSPAVFLLFALLITAEWILRKICRML